MADPVYTFIERQGDSEGLLFTNSLRISLLFTEGQFARFLSSIEKEPEQRFFDSYTFIFEYLEQDEKDEILFSIIRQATIDSIGNQIKEYYTFEDTAVRRKSDGTLIYGSSELDFLLQNYAPSEPQLQISLDEETLSNISFQNSIPTDPISYDSLSSLGNITQESFTISVTIGSATELITEEAETVTDVGGLSSTGRNRTIGNTGVSSQISASAASAGVSTSTVRTSGY